MNEQKWKHECEFSVVSSFLSLPDFKISPLTRSTYLPISRLSPIYPSNKDIPIGGLPSFLTNAQKVLFGSDIVSRCAASSSGNKISTIQSLSGTGALNLLSQYASKFASSRKIVIPNPTWGNHKAIFKANGLSVEEYTYLDPLSPRQPRIDFERTFTEVR